MGYNLAFTNQTAKKIFNKEAPIIIDSANTNDPGKAYIKKLEKILSFIENPMFLSKAPIAMKLAPKAMAGLSNLFIENKPFKNILILIINHQGKVYLHLNF